MEVSREEPVTVSQKFGSSGGASRDQPVHGATAESSLVQQTKSPMSPRRAVTALQFEINQNRNSAQSAMRIGDLVQHFRQRELRTEFARRTFSTRNSHEGNLRKWIVPRWNEHPTKTLKAGEVELWLRSLPLARASCAKLRNLMSILFNHGVRHGICDANPIRLVRQGAKRKKIPHASARVTLDTYTQAITEKKRRAQTRVVRLLVNRETRKK